MRALLSALLLFALGLAVPSFGHAGGYFLPTRGIRALSMGGASIAGASDADAFWLNPANIRETALVLEVAALHLESSFEREGFEAVSNQAAPLPNPTLAFVYQVMPELSIGLGFYAPYAAGQRYPETGPQRYALIGNDRSAILITQLSAALHLGRFSFGVGIQNVSAQLVESVAISAYTGLFGHAEDPELDMFGEVTLDDPLTLTGNFGLSIDLDRFRFGASVQLPYTIGGDAQFVTRLPSSPSFDGVTVDGDSISFDAPFPFQARAGLLWQAHADLVLELAGGFEGWSVQEQILASTGGKVTLRNVPGIGDYAVGSASVLREMTDTLSIHLGGDYALTKDFNVRAGGFFETSAFEDATYSVSVLADDRVGATLGASYRVSKFRFDVAAGRVFQGTRTITNSRVRQINPANPQGRAVIGNGRYTSNFWVGGLSAAYFFGS